VTDTGTPAGWYEDPSGVGELRYHDGTRWTEHVTIDGQQTTAPYGLVPASFTMSRLAQWRTEDEKPLEVVGPSGVVGRFVTLLDGKPSYRFEDAQGDAVLTVSKPSLKNAVEIADPAGYPVGTIAKIGRLRSRYDLTFGDGPDTATVKLAGGATDEWELQSAEVVAATVIRTITSAADALNLAAVDYRATTTGPLDDQLHRLLLVVPIAIDILDTQAL
jgi:hypothetical protein